MEPYWLRAIVSELVPASRYTRGMGRPHSVLLLELRSAILHAHETSFYSASRGTGAL